MMIELTRVLVVLLGGGLGAAARYLLGSAILNRYPGGFPLGTFAINISGSFLIGLLMTILLDRAQPVMRLFVVTGLLGGYTTFSALEWEAYLLTPGAGVAYLLLSGAVGFAACAAGASLARMVH